MKLGILKARIKRSNLSDNAGKYYINESSELIINLNESYCGDKSIFFGIQKEDNIYTVISKNFILLSNGDGKKYELDITEFSRVIYENLVDEKKKTINEFIEINNLKIWVHSKNTLSSILNVILWLESQT